MGQMNDLNNRQNSGFVFFILFLVFFIYLRVCFYLLWRIIEKHLDFSHCEENCHGEYAHRWKAKRECAWLAGMGEQRTITIAPSLGLAGNKMQECVLVCTGRRERNAMRIARFSLYLERVRIFYLWFTKKPRSEKKIQGCLSVIHIDSVVYNYYHKHWNLLGEKLTYRVLLIVYPQDISGVYDTHTDVWNS